MDLEVCSLEKEKIRQLSKAEVTELKLDSLSLESLSDLKDYVTLQGYADVARSVEEEIRMRCRPRLAKITACCVVVTALRYNIISGATCKAWPEPEFGCYSGLNCGLDTPLLQLVQFAFGDPLIDAENYDDPSIYDDATDMSNLVNWCIEQGLQVFDEDGVESSSSDILAACETILEALQTDEGRLFDEIAGRLQKDQSITAADVRELVRQHTPAVRIQKGCGATRDQAAAPYDGIRKPEIGEVVEFWVEGHFDVECKSHNSDGSITVKLLLPKEPGIARQYDGDVWEYRWVVGEQRDL